MDLGFVGEPEHVDVRVIHALTGAGLIPVIAPVGVGADGQTYNINADTVAGAVAGALGAADADADRRAGVLDRNRNLIPEMTLAEAEAGIRDGLISGGMIPKVECCIDAVRGGVKAAVILDGRQSHACLLELFTEGLRDPHQGLIRSIKARSRNHDRGVDRDQALQDRCAINARSSWVRRSASASGRARAERRHPRRPGPPRPAEAGQGISG